MCGTCARELGLLPTTPEIAELDRLIRMAQGLIPCDDPESHKEEVTS